MKSKSNSSEGKAAALIVERISLANLLPHPRNPRVHPEPGSPAWKVIQKSIEHDYFDPLVWNKRNGMLVSGHLRRKILEASGFTEADCVVVDYDEQTHVARMIAANKSGGDNDDAALKSILEQLRMGEFDADLTGFHSDEIDCILAGDLEPVPPTDFKSYDENVATEFQCPKCQFKWSGKPV